MSIPFVRQFLDDDGNLIANDVMNAAAEAMLDELHRWATRCDRSGRPWSPPEQGARMGEERDIHQICPRFHAAIELIGARWTGAILVALMEGQNRYATIKAAVPGLSDTMLAERLRSLESEDIVERRVIPSTPVQVEYYLTAKGQDLEQVVKTIETWSHRWIPVPQP